MENNKLKGIEELEEVIKDLKLNPSLSGLGVKLQVIKEKILLDILKIKIK